MKRLILSAAAFVAASGFAASSATESSNELGVLQVTSTATRTLISVPWCAMSSGDTEISVSNIVKTANLTAGDTIHAVKTDGTFDTWRLQNVGGVLAWAKVVQVGEGSGVGNSGDPSATELARGNSLILIRNNPTNETGVAKAFYLVGQFTTTPASPIKVDKGTDDEPVSSLLASPRAGAWKVNENATWNWGGEACTNDYLSIDKGAGLRDMLYWSKDAEKWGTLSNLVKKVKTPRGGEKTVVTGTVHVVYSDPIPAGQGIWYVSKGGEPTITWKEESK